jgi:hypothetical protein
MGDKVLPDFQPNLVAAINIKGDSRLDVVRTNGLWRVRQRWDYPANFGQISDFLIRLKELKVVEAETVGTSDLGRVNLDEPGKGNNSGTLVEFRDAEGKVLASLLMGKKHARARSETRRLAMSGNESDGRYLLLPAEPNEVLLVSNTLAVLEPRPEAWLSRDFFKVERIKSIVVSSTDPANSWKVLRESEISPWVLLDRKTGEILDTNKVAKAVNALAAPRFTDVAAPRASAETGFDKPVEVTVQTFDQFTYKLKIGAKAGDDSYFMTVKVTADLPADPVTGHDEKIEDKQKSGPVLDDQTKKLRAKLAQESALDSWVYLVNTWILNPVIASRAEVLEGEKNGGSVESNLPVSPAASKTSDSTTAQPGWTPGVIK